MNRAVAARFALLPGIRAGIGPVGMRNVVADRPEGLAGRQGLGFNRAEPLAAALGGCFWNDLHYAPQAAGIVLGDISFGAEETLAGTPPSVRRAAIHARVGATDLARARARDRSEAACRASTIANSVTAAFPVAFVLEES